ncbi:hypothetical protein SLEP1_g9337 [Rubroshorea leprosula]|uniref:DEAD-box ATP-dependent RNA helicase 50 n=1 Tax=Rubroshorea leprosula TaxID=152421 RepID=A0AAV5I937_9ROSI|nr:hypothetical protein SLEP1_g9337 [Rubroshorea leprosula]
MLAKVPSFPFSFPSPTPWKRPCVLHSHGCNLVVVRAGYTRTPLETAGAYQLVDDETGEKVIVWGGDDPGDDVIPPKHLLHPSNWKPTRSSQSRSQSPGRAAAVGFERLKADKVKALVKKSSRMKKEGSKLTNFEDEQVPQNHARRVSRAAPSNEYRISSQATKTEDYIEEDSDLSVESGVEPISELQIASHKAQKLDFRNSESEERVSKGSAAQLRGWGVGESSYNPKSNSMDLLKQQRKGSVDSDFFSRKSFRDLGCSEYMIESLKAQQFLRPSRIQALAFAPVNEGKTCIIADQSGSGKTLAYLIPVIQRLREEELQGLSKSSSGSPRVIIMVPTAELASQVLSNCRSMSKLGVPFRSMVVTGGFRQKTQLENLEQGIDVLIATPGRFMFLIKEGFLQLTNLRCAVLDEVDILCNDEDFEVALKSLITSSPVAAQYLFVTATLPVDIYNKLVEVFPDCEVIMGPGMHRTSSGLEEFLVDCSGEGDEKTPDTAFMNKKNALLKLVEESLVHKTIVFCNKIETCRKVENALKRFDRKGTRVRVLPFHAALEQEVRLSNMKEFTNSQRGEESLFLVCTDRASRGIDFVGVGHVVLFDFPREPSEYVRRVGRTARGAGGKGKAFVFAVGKQVSLASKIMERNRKGRPLHDVPSAYELPS